MVLQATKMLGDDWCSAVEAESFAGILSSLAAEGDLPDGVDTSHPRILLNVQRCYEMKTRGWTLGPHGRFIARQQLHRPPAGR